MFHGVLCTVTLASSAGNVLRMEVGVIVGKFANQSIVSRRNAYHPLPPMCQVAILATTIIIVHPNYVTVINV